MRSLQRYQEMLSSARGAVPSEYALMIGLLALASLPCLRFMSTDIETSFRTVTLALDGNAAEWAPVFGNRDGDGRSPNSGTNAPNPSGNGGAPALTGEGGRTDGTVEAPVAQAPQQGGVLP